MTDHDSSMKAVVPTLGVPESAWTFSGFRAWTCSPAFPEKCKIAFVHNEIFVDRSPERIEGHGKVKSELARVLGGLFVEEDRGEFFIDSTRIVHEQAEVSNEPDLVFVTWESLEEGRVTTEPVDDNPDEAIEINGAPDCVVEIISPSSVTKDTVRLRAAYYQAGIGEYWLIDARGATIAFDILIPGTTGYEATQRQRGGWVASALFQRRFRLKRTRNRHDRIQYRLEVKPL